MASALSYSILPCLPKRLPSWRNSNVVQGKTPTTVDPRALLFVAAEVILEGLKADEQELQRIRDTGTSRCKLITFPAR
jgi:hypothetical protein